jgi:type I restriction enzyme, S subunit
MSSLSELVVENIEIWTSSENVKRSGRGRSANSRSNLYGVGKLRDLILELAIKGRLVTQDESEDPAENILKKIELDRVKPNALGARSKKNSVSNISQNIDSVKLPVGWTIACLGDVVEIIRGITFPGSEKSRLPEPGRIACLRTTNVQDQIDWDDMLYIGEKFVSRENQLLKPKDIVMSMANSRELVGKVALVNAVSEKTTFGGFLGVLRTSSINPDFLMIFLRAPSTRASLIESSIQTTNIANISLAKLNPLVFAIPPLAEQSRIANKVNELMSICDQLETLSIDSASHHQNIVRAFLSRLTISSESLKESTDNLRLVLDSLDELIISEASIESFKEAVFQLAIMGKLVNQDENEPSASVLLGEINEDKRHAVNSGRIDGKSDPVSQSELPFSLPDNWCWVRLADVSGYIQYGFNDSANPTNKEPLLLRITDIQDDQVNWNSVPGCNASIQDVQNYVLRNGDIVIARTGGTIGKSYLVRGLNGVAIFASYLIRIGSIPKISPEYKKIFFSSPLYWQQLISSSMGTGQPNVNGTALKKLLFPLPPLGEQHRIVAKVNQLINICDDLKTKINQSSLLQQKIADVLVDQLLA